MRVDCTPGRDGLRGTTIEASGGRSMLAAWCQFQEFTHSAAEGRASVSHNTRSSSAEMECTGLGSTVGACSTATTTTTRGL